MTDSGDNETAPPATLAQINPQVGASDQMQVLQALTEVQKDVSSINVKVERLINDVRDLSSDVKVINGTIAYFKGGTAMAAVMLIAFGGFMYWLIGERLDGFRDELITSKSVQTGSAESEITD